MLVSFIVVAYNAEKYLNKCLDSLKKQNYPHKKIEVILVDSNSLDKTKKIIDKKLAAERQPFILKNFKVSEG